MKRLTAALVLCLSLCAVVARAQQVAECGPSSPPDVLCYCPSSGQMSVPRDCQGSRSASYRRVPSRGSIGLDLANGAVLSAAELL